MKFLVTGGCGFIGSTAVKTLLSLGHSVVNIDKLTYAADLRSLGDVTDRAGYAFIQADICDRNAIDGIFATHQPDIVMHLAAETHVDRSIDGPADFVRTNIVGTYTLLEAALAYWGRLDASGKARFRFHHVSTDEVFGSLGPKGAFTETTPYDPRSPYSATKASSDHMVRAWYHTYGLPVVLSNCSNNYGPFQFPEKLIPLMVLNCLHEKPLPVYGRGENVRDWLHVDDHARALHLVATQGQIGGSYNIGGRSERSNLQVVNAICTVLGEMRPRANGLRYSDLIIFVADRPGHDFRYAIDPSKIETELSFLPSVVFEDGLRGTILWYLQNEWWWHPLAANRYNGQRLGLSAAKVGS